MEVDENSVDNEGPTMFVYLFSGWKLWVHQLLLNFYISFVVYRSQYSRTSDDIKSMIKLAKLNEKQLTDVTQVIYYGDTESSDDWKLLELNGPLLKAVEEGQVLSFKGKKQIRQIL